MKCQEINLYIKKLNMPRVAKKEKKHRIDLRIPVNQAEIRIPEDDCLGKMYDLSTKECQQCNSSERALCGILFMTLVNKKAKASEKKLGSKFLDVADFTNLTYDTLSKHKDFEVGKTNTKKLMEIACELSNCDDVISVKNAVVKIIKSSNLYTKEGVVWSK